MGTAMGAESPADSVFGELGSRTFAAAIAFGLAAISAGFGIARAGSAGLAASAERPEIRTIAIWRYDDAGRLRGDFILDRPEFRDAKILVTGRNFGI
ncbi:MAG: hypothetical protein QXD32_00335, partial [Nitrososphaerota archaeon]